MENFDIWNVFYFIALFIVLRGTFYLVTQTQAVIIERLGKFHKVSKAGLHLKIPLIDSISGNLNLRVRELPVEVETKTKDDVFVRIVVSVQFFVIASED